MWCEHTCLNCLQPVAHASPDISDALSNVSNSCVRKVRGNTYLQWHFMFFLDISLRLGNTYICQWIMASWVYHFGDCLSPIRVLTFTLTNPTFSCWKFYLFKIIVLCGWFHFDMHGGDIGIIAYVQVQSLHRSVARAIGDLVQDCSISIASALEILH